MGYKETSADFVSNTEMANPRLRVNMTTPMTLTTTFQTVMLNGTSPFNTNTFLTIPGQTSPSVSYDTTTGLFKFTANTDKNYTFFITTRTTSTTTLNGLVTVLNGVLSIGTLQIRCRIPRPAGSGGNVMFPDPDGNGYLDVAPINLITSITNQQPIAVFANQLVRDYGFYLEARLSNSLSGTNVLANADVNVFAR